jgi:hypothetical protein
MRPLRYSINVILLSLALATSCVHTRAAGLDVRVLRKGQPVVVGRAESIAAKLIAVAESCSVNSTRNAAAGNGWKPALASGSYVQVIFQSPHVLNLMDGKGRTREALPVHALLLPLPEGNWPAHVYVQVAGEVLSLTKYTPRSLTDLAQEPDLQLAAVKPYSSLTDARSAR